MFNHKFISTALGLCVSVALAAGTYCLVPANDATIAWQTATPASRGMDAAALLSLEAALRERDTEAFLVVRQNAIVHEWYAPPPLKGRLLPWTPEPAARRHGTASMAKAIVGGMALLVTLCDGRIDPDQPASTYIPDWRDDPVRSQITMRQLATHSSGIEDALATAGPEQAEADWKGRYWKDRSARFAIGVAEAPVIFSPGTALHYSTPGFSALEYALAASLRDAPQPDVRELLRERIMEPLEIPAEAWAINYDDDAHEVDGLALYVLGAGGSYTARAVARIGQLILNRGEWQGRRILDPNCVDTAVTHAGTALPEDWGLQRHPAPALGWWTNARRVWPGLPTDTLVGAGAAHRVLVVIPSLDLVAVRFGRKSLGEAHFGGDYWAALERDLLEPLVRAVQQEEEAPDLLPEEPTA
jgi:CubicO group peptidase (beta-lactamase class C family)